MSAPVRMRRERCEVPMTPELPILPVMPLRHGSFLPHTLRALLVGRPGSLAALDAADGSLLVAVQREPKAVPEPDDLLPIGVVARIVERASTGDGPERVVLQGLHRAAIEVVTGTEPCLTVRARPLDERWPDTPEADAMKALLRDELANNAEGLGPERVDALLGLPPLAMVDATAAALPEPDRLGRELLVMTDPLARAERLVVELVRLREAHAARRSIQERVQNATQNQQREYLLRQQLDAIRQELGNADDADVDLAHIREKLADAGLPEEVEEAVERELRRLDRLNHGNPERQVALDWLEWVASLPWNRRSATEVDLNTLERALDASHHGLDDVKREVLEHLAVRRLTGAAKSEVLLLLGPPGVGKTSIGAAIAEATGRELVRVALGGMRDEAELRGHRRTYIGARPGRLIEGLRRAGTADPVVLLDEVDKLGNGPTGDPAAALLEILDPEQNHAFVDRYLEVPFDLSGVLFVATANDLSGIPAPLRDRLQILEIAGYTPAEKQVIARRHLLPQAAERTGLQVSDVELTDEALRAIIHGWTREAGVRALQRRLSKLYRTAALHHARGERAPLRVDVSDLPQLLGKRPVLEPSRESLARPGIARGLAWTPAGGEVLYVEASTLPGSGKLVLTGQLGDVMKESARAALTYVLAHGDRLGIPLGVMDDHDVHIHVPAGATPKDGPSAGVTMFTALASLLSKRPVRDDIAMTGEATLRGRVLPVGGIKAKVLAAHRAGLKRVLLPAGNRPDLDDLPDEIRSSMEIVLVERMGDVLEAALEREPVRSEAA